VTTTVPASSSAALLRWGVLAVVAAACLPYLSTLHDYFLQEDFGSVQLFASKPWTTFPRWFAMPWTEDIWGYVPDEIRPFTALAFQITTRGRPTAPEVGHVLNYALHAGNCLLALAIARSVAGLSPLAAIFAALVFALLPAQAESVAWITGRVDSLPAFCYLATFLVYARWRLSGASSVPAYVGSLALFFTALFTKQTTITMVGTLVLFDWLVADRPPRMTWSYVRPYAPFAVMTAAYLALRYVVVGTVIRESKLSAQGVVYFGELFARHLRRVVTGEPGALSPVAWSAIGAATVALMLAAFLPGTVRRRRVARAALFIGPVWWIIGVAPVLVAGYESPRHAYLASVAWAGLLGLALDELLRMPGRVWRAAAVASAVLVLSIYLLQLRMVVREWKVAAATSKRAAARLEREALAAPRGSLVIIGVPVRIWEWAYPFVTRPPFTRMDLNAHARVIMPLKLHCCRAPWFDDTKKMLREWVAQPDHPPIVALYTDPRTGSIARLTDAENPGLRTVIPMLLDTGSADALDKALVDVLEKMVGPR